MRFNLRHIGWAKFNRDIVLNGLLLHGRMLYFIAGVVGALIAFFISPNQARYFGVGAHGRCHAASG